MNQETIALVTVAVASLYVAVTTPAENAKTAIVQREAAILPIM